MMSSISAAAAAAMTAKKVWSERRVQSEPHPLTPPTDSPEEGEIRPVKRRRLPSYSPPPEDEWAPAIRMVVTSSKVLSTGTMFLVTQEGASIGR